MEPDTNQNNAKDDLKKLWTEEIAVRKEANRWGTLSNVGFVGLVATEMPEFLAKNTGGKTPWRVPLFIASSVSVVAGVVMNYLKGNKAEAMREHALMQEHGHTGEQPPKGQWSEKVATQQDTQADISR